MNRLIVSLLLCLILALAGCAESGEGGQVEQDEIAKYQKITAEDAKARLESESGIVLLDVRTPEEYREAHIPNAVLLPVDNIEEDAATVIPDKDSVYFVYCRSGNRSAAASELMLEMGYKNVYDLGGIKDWPYETVSGD